jgi:hypothetical protein
MPFGPCRDATLSFHSMQAFLVIFFLDQVQKNVFDFTRNALLMKTVVLEYVDERVMMRKLNTPPTGQASFPRNIAT